MRIYGLDFTSAPSKKKPITCAVATFKECTLFIEHIRYIYSFEEFEELLVSPGPWFMAIDFPFSLPREWVEAMNWPTAWGDYVEFISSMTLDSFLGHIKDYRTKQPKGKKYHFRPVDRLAKSCSPMMIDYTPVGRMFYQGAQRLYRSGACIPLLSIRKSDRYIVEGYPALIARRFIAKDSYKSDVPKRQTGQRETARAEIVRGLLTARIQNDFGFKICLEGIDLQNLITEPGADSLDAILCAIQAAWAFTRQHMDTGIPEVPGLGTLEGWITDPDLLPDDYEFYNNVT